MGNTGRHISGQKIGSHQPITKDFVRKVKNFMNNFEVDGGSMHFDGVRARLKINARGVATSAAASTDHPFRVYRNDDGATKRVSVTPGSINGLVPTNIFSPLTITGSGVEYVIVTLSVAGGAVPDPDSALLSVSSTHPDPSDTTSGGPPASAADVIAVLSDGVVSQIRNDNLTATSTEVLTESVWNASTEGYDLTTYYRWEVS